MPYIPPEVVVRAREMDLLTYLRTYEPQELVHFGGNTYCTREHDSLKISNGKWDRRLLGTGLSHQGQRDALYAGGRNHYGKSVSGTARFCPGSESAERKGAAFAAGQPLCHTRRRIPAPQGHRL